MKKKTEIAFRLTPAAPEKEVTFHLAAPGSYSHDVILSMTDEMGETWAVVGITKEGKLVRYRDIPHDVGLSVNENGYVEIIDEP